METVKMSPSPFDLSALLSFMIDQFCYKSHKM